MDTIDYKGFQIRSAIYPREPLNEFKIRVSIACHMNDQDRETHFDGNDTFTSLKGAEDASIKFGKDIIDGKYPGLSTAELIKP